MTMPEQLNLKHVIDIFVNLSNKDTVEDWQKQYTTYASIEQINERSVQNSESGNFGHVIIASYFIFTIRYLQDIKIGMRVLFRQQLYILEKIVNENYDNRFLKLIAKEI